MTEQEAKTKTCLMTLGPVASADGSAPWHSPSCCIGSACMGWRDTDREFRMSRPHGTETAEPTRGKPGEGWEWSPWDRANGEPSGWIGPRRGFCGLAGKP